MDELYEMANEMFDEEVFTGAIGNDLLEEYNNLPDDEAREKLYDIVNEMQEEAREAIDKAMKDVVRKHKNEFVRIVRQKWACPDCSDQFEGKYVMLTRTATNGWVCPQCGCSTSYPQEDACFDMTDSPLLG